MRASWENYMGCLQAVLTMAVQTGMNAREFVNTYRERSVDVLHTGHAIVAQVEDISRILRVPVSREFMRDLRSIGYAEAGTTTSHAGAQKAPRAPKVTQPAKTAHRGPAVTVSRADVAVLFGETPAWVTTHRESLGLVTVMGRVKGELTFGYTVGSVEAALRQHESTGSGACA
jgi:hypothetical protein